MITDRDEPPPELCACNVSIVAHRCPVCGAEVCATCLAEHEREEGFRSPRVTMSRAQHHMLGMALLGIGDAAVQAEMEADMLEEYPCDACSAEDKRSIGTELCSYCQMAFCDAHWKEHQKRSSYCASRAREDERADLAYSEWKDEGR